MRTMMLAPVAMTMLVLGLAAIPLSSAEETTCPEGQVETPEGCSQQAWTDDCPPDMLCASSHSNTTDEPVAYGNDSCIECSGPIEFGNESCIDCSGLPPETCMDGADANETCDPDVYYMDDPTRGPEDGSCEFCRGDEAEDDTLGAESRRDTPGLAAASVLIGLAALAGFARRK